VPSDPGGVLSFTVFPREVVVRLYEGMFLLDSGRAGKEWDAVQAEMTALLGKHGASVAKMGRWDERKLAYEIKGHRRATYLLTYFHADPTSIDGIRRDCSLSTLVIRNLILAREDDHAIPDDVGRVDTPVEREPVGALEGGRFDGPRPGGRDRDGDRGGGRDGDRGGGRDGGRERRSRS